MKKGGHRTYIFMAPTHGFRKNIKPIINKIANKLFYDYRLRNIVANNSIVMLKLDKINKSTFIMCYFAFFLKNYLSLKKQVFLILHINPSSYSLPSYLYGFLLLQYCKIKQLPNPRGNVLLTLENCDSGQKKGYENFWFIRGKFSTSKYLSFSVMVTTDLSGKSVFHVDRERKEGEGGGEEGKRRKKRKRAKEERIKKNKGVDLFMLPLGFCLPGGQENKRDGKRILHLMNSLQMAQLFFLGWQEPETRVV